VDCKKLASSEFRNHAIIAKPISKGSDCKWCRGERGMLNRLVSWTTPWFS